MKYIEKVEEALSHPNSPFKNYPYKKETTFDILFDNIPKNMRKKRVDLFIPSFNVIIEVNGEQHYAPVIFTNDNKEVGRFISQVKRDKILRVYAEEHGYILIEIPFNFIKSCTEEEIATTLFNLLKGKQCTH